ncbi:tellurite resistance protein TerB [Micromonospora phaseoli]|uniref:Tellurite resistance protein TerB n=1 Tax=Micromonospora phaseoli TaxID=1144548 RepID=A0A1H6UMY9_9ACTN|nr:metalloregulator ArsR/SmtB family transcription factor [Micromonospora phaseoli]PZV99078.1 DNA-binding transcriptional ArsR family regulator [Micromonospora phaseoli]GIJ78720.1 hypothetical protein Xph01_31520 [Micromonospora phaseoli]SEI93659.1 tellurite resistance protein TerB [Micromonospora phaseoli]
MGEPTNSQEVAASLTGARGPESPGPVELSERTHDFLKALASSSRQRIMLLFAQGAELSVSEVAERAGIGQSTASEQLALLRRGGILDSRREGKIVLYRADRDGVLSVLDDLRSYLLTCC